MRLATRVVCLVLAGGALVVPAAAGAAAKGTSFHVLVLTEGNNSAAQYEALRKAANKANAEVRGRRGQAL